MFAYPMTHGCLETVLNYTFQVLLRPVNGRGETLKLPSLNVPAVLSLTLPPRLLQGNFYRWLYHHQECRPGGRVYTYVQFLELIHLILPFLSTGALYLREVQLKPALFNSLEAILELLSSCQHDAMYCMALSSITSVAGT